MIMTKDILYQQIFEAEKQGREKMADDIYRQGYHLMPPSGWMNDPNGLCWYKGNYHVFYQHSPLDANRGNIFWGHYTSPDLLTWTKQPTFLYPVDPWDLNGVYSGSALVEDDALYLYYTGNVKYPGDYDYIYEGRGHNVCLAVAKDGIHMDSNEVLLSNDCYPSNMSCHVRDPKVWKMESIQTMYFEQIKQIQDWPIKQAHKKLIKMAKEKGVIVSFDPNVRLPLWDSAEDCKRAIQEFLPFADIVKLSDDEVEFVTGCKTEKETVDKLLSETVVSLLLQKEQRDRVYIRKMQVHRYQPLQ